MQGKAVAVTGASSGIGFSTVKLLTNRSVHVFATVRKEEDARNLSQTFGDKVTPLMADVTDEVAIKSAAEKVREALGGRTLWGLVNNAGVAVEGPLLHLETDEFRHQLEVNLVSAHQVTRAFAPLLGSDKTLQGQPGRIVNISSVGGRVGGPFLGAYVASKHGLEGYSETLRRELMPYGVDVVIVGPGSVRTPIWEKAEARDTGRFRTTDYKDSLERFKAHAISEGRKGLSPEVIAETVWQALDSKKPKTRYAPVPNPLVNWVLPRLLPSRWVDRMIARSVGLNPRVEW